MGWSFSIHSTNMEISRTINFRADLKLININTFIDYRPRGGRVIGVLLILIILM